MKTRGVVFPLGEIIAYNVSFEPIVNMYGQHVQDRVHLIIMVECPGVRLQDVDLEELPNGVKIRLEKHVAIDEQQVEAVSPLQQQHGTWEREFVYDPSEGHFELHEPGSSPLEFSVLTVVLSRRHARRAWNLGRVQAAASTPASASHSPSASLGGA